jgi:hypothetical protein
MKLVASCAWLLQGFLAASFTAADDHVIEPRGEYAKIDVRLANETIATLLSGVDAEVARAIRAVEQAPQKYAPPVFFVLSNVLFDRGRKDDGAFWFYAGQLRARFDANRCADESARQAVSVLTEEFGPKINQYMFKDFARVEALVPKVVDWDRKTPHEYDHRWINLHGMAAMIESLDKPAGQPKPLSLPRAQWDAIADKTRADYLDGFQKARAMMQARAASPSPSTVPAPAGWEKQLVGHWKQELSSVLAHFPTNMPGQKPGEAGRREAAERFGLDWVVTPDTIAVVNLLVAPVRRAPPWPYRVVSVEGNAAELAVTPAEGSPFSWTIESLEPDLIRLMSGIEEVYRLRRVGAAAKPR